MLNSHLARQSNIVCNGGTGLEIPCSLLLRRQWKMLVPKQFPRLRSLLKRLAQITVFCQLPLLCKRTEKLWVTLSIIYWTYLNWSITEVLWAFSKSIGSQDIYTCLPQVNPSNKHLKSRKRAHWCTSIGCLCSRIFITHLVIAISWAL